MSFQRRFLYALSKVDHYHPQSFYMTWLYLSTITIIWNYLLIYLFIMHLLSLNENSKEHDSFCSFLCLMQGKHTTYIPLIKLNTAGKSHQSCPTLCDPIDGSPPGSSVHGFLQARTLELVAISFSKGIFSTQESNPGLLHCRQILYWLSYEGSPSFL